MVRILVVEDEPDVREVLRFNLAQAGYEVFGAPSGRDGINLARQRRPDLVLLDWMLPDVSGIDVCRSLKDAPTTRRIPVVMLTARTDEIDKVVAFELGVEDYVTKPFSVRELLLRIRAILRRAEGEPALDPVIQFGVLRVDRDAHRAWVEGAEVELTPIEFRLLVTLYDRKNRVQSRDQLLEDVWGSEARVHERTVDAHVKRLREKLLRAGDYVETVRGVGYRFAPAPEAS